MNGTQPRPRLANSVALSTRVALNFSLAVDTPMIFMLRPRSSAGQWVSGESYRIEPPTPVEEFTDPYGNLCQRLVAWPGQFLVEARAEVRVPAHLDRAPGPRSCRCRSCPRPPFSTFCPAATARRTGSGTGPRPW